MHHRQFSRLCVLLALSLALSTGLAPAQTSPKSAPAAKPAEGPAPSLVSISAGAMIAVHPKEYSGGWSALNLIDESPSSGWATPKGVVSPQTIVIALPEKTLLKTLAFDVADTDCDRCGAKDILVEVSDTGESTGFQKIAQVTLKDKADNQSFPVQAEVPGRWVRLTVQANHGSADYIELMDFRATGRQLTRTPVSNISGTYDTNYGLFHVRQEGTSVSGCYEHDSGVLSGGVEGRVLKFTWREGERGQQQGPAIMVISPDGKELLGLWWENNASGPPSGVWNGKKVGDEVGGCPHWSGGAAEQITQDLAGSGRSRIYGINFDTDSAVIKAESKPTLDKIVSVLKANPGWKMTVEGHTDSTGGAAHNQALSEQRARAVVASLAAAGIEAARLRAVGFGASKPVASNDTELGRSQNRRVELVRQ